MRSFFHLFMSRWATTHVIIATSTAPVIIILYRLIQYAMKLSFLVLILPIVTAVDSAEERGTSSDENHIADLLGATSEGPVVLADLDRRSSSQPAYCYSPTPANYNCYR